MQKLIQTIENLKLISNGAPARPPSGLNISDRLAKSSPSATEFYRLRIGRILRTVTKLSSRVLSNSEFAELVEVWAEALENVIPEARLESSLTRAIRDHDSPFQINAYDLITAHRQLEIEYDASAQQRRDDDARQNKPAHCPERDRHKSPDDALQEYLVGPDYQFLPCARCRPDAYWQRIREIKSTLTTKRNIDMALQIAEAPTEII